MDPIRTTPALLVCAPAGSGKSMTVAAWLRRNVAGAMAWVHLTHGHDEPGQAWSAILEALRRADAGLGAALGELEELAARAPGEVPTRLAGLFGADRRDTFLVLDDLQSIRSSDVHDQLVELVAAAGASLHLIAISRHDPPWPLHRMRLDGLLTDLRTDALAFDEAEASLLFRSLDLPLSGEEVRRLVARTEGWAAGLRLAAMGAGAAQDPTAFLADLSGRSEYIADYLLREVFDTQPPEWRAFLIRVSAVDEFCADLADHLGDSSDSAEVIDDLIRQNAFIRQLDDRPGWYRLHPLLLDFARSRMATASRRRLLHQRAARWFAGEDEPLTALDHAIAAQDWALAAQLIGLHVVSWTVRRPPGTLLRRLRSVPEEAVLTEPGLAIGLASALSVLGRPGEVPRLVATAEPLLSSVSEAERRRFELVLDLIELGNRRWSGDLTGVLEACRRTSAEPAVLSTFGLSDWASLRTLLLSNAGCCELWLGEEDAALTHLRTAAREGGAGHPLAMPTLNAQAHLAYLYWANGELGAAEAMARRVVDALTRIAVPTAIQGRCAYLAMAGVAFERDDTEATRQWLAHAVASESDPHTSFVTELMLVRTTAAQAGLVEAVAALRRLRADAAGIPAALEECAAQLEDELLARTTGTAVPRTAPVRLTEVVDGTASATMTPRAELARVLAATCGQLRAGSEESALELLEVGLVAAAPERFRQPFLALAARLHRLLATRIDQGTREVEFAVDLLSRMRGGASDRSASNLLLVPLTEREAITLRYLATTMTTREIADELYVSVNTVKTHQRAIHQKLGARDRRSAVTHARQLGLI